MIQEPTETVICEAVSQQAIKWQLKSYIAECVQHEAGVGQTCTLMSLIKMLEKKGGPSQGTIDVRLREVSVQFWCGGELLRNTRNP